MADYMYMMESRLTPEQLKGVSLMQDVAQAHSLNLYLAGGAVRDIISGSSIRDLDFTVEGNPSKLLRDLEKAGAQLQGEDNHLHVLLIELPGQVRAELAMARAEKYGKPGRPPEISSAAIIEDLRRRDFTVNAMGLSLNPGSRGLLLDPSNGVADIEAKQLRVLHNYAFLEDPSRLIRAARFAARFKWTLEERTRARYDSALDNRYIAYIQESAIGREIEQMAYEDEPLAIMRALEKEGWLRVLHPRWSVAKADSQGLSRLLKTRQQMSSLGYSSSVAPAVMYFITSRMSSHDVGELQKLIPRKAFVQTWKHLEDDAAELSRRLLGKEASTPSRAWQMLSATRPESIIFLEVTARRAAVKQKLRNFMGKWRQVKQRFPLPEMLEMRITPDLPAYPKLIEQMFLLMLDGKLRSKSELTRFLKPYEPPPPPPPPPPKRAKVKGEKGEKEGKEAEAAHQAPPEKGKGKKKAAAPLPAPKAETKPVAKTPAKPPAKPAAKPAAKPKPAPKKAAIKKVKPKPKKKKKR